MLSTFWCRAAHCNPVFPVQSLFVLHRKLPNSFCIEGWHDSTVDAVTTVASRKMQPTSKMKMFGKVKLKLKILFHVTCQYSGLVLPLLLGDPEPRWRHQDVGVLQLPDGPNIPWLFLPFQNWLLVIDDGDLFLWLLAKLVTRFEGSQLRFISCKIWFWSHIHQFWGKLSQPKLTLKNTWLSLLLFLYFYYFRDSVLTGHHQERWRHHWDWRWVHHLDSEETEPSWVTIKPELKYYVCKADLT